MMGALQKSCLGDCSQMHLASKSQSAPSKYKPLMSAPSTGADITKPVCLALSKSNTSVSQLVGSSSSVNLN